jgi:hypothetical protein
VTAIWINVRFRALCGLSRTYHKFWEVHWGRT